MIATTWITVLRGTQETTFTDEIDTFTETGIDALTRIPASLIETTRTSQTPVSGTPRVVRATTARIRAGTAVQADDQIRDERTGRIYSIDQINQPAAIGITAELRLDLTLIN
ncbi:hypothetical protein GCM10010193_70520 [Kitasatospora atroaurantiaca]|uniref:Head-tail joining protein n=1 Tax=Kitasatospora atroaurantiaca TaxID=285545 RepID=A0A561ENF4_9ACTN|nr:hypothetical protein [Kitasatospora atroaurantiaca]TWE17137.1 hypothetical protein FB465_2142 [Kitasatospora atroaurantiaca]